jgi:hypothetical protein
MIMTMIMIIIMMRFECKGGTVWKGIGGRRGWRSTGRG